MGNNHNFQESYGFLLAFFHHWFLLRISVYSAYLSSLGLTRLVCIALGSLQGIIPEQIFTQGLTKQ